MKDLSDERLRALYAAHAADSPDTPHPDPTQLADAAVGRGSPEMRMATLDHALTCAACRHELNLLEAAADTAGRLQQRTFQMRLWLAAAAVIVIGLGIVTNGRGPLQQLWRPRNVDTERGADAEGASGRKVIDVVSPIGNAAPGTPARFVWRRVLGVTSYTVEVVGDSGLVMRSETRDTVLAWPRLSQGRTYRWRVSAIAPDGSALRSPFTDLQLPPP